jgi:eukaryotic-like serine/threonine-protein kinase
MPGQILGDRYEVARQLGKKSGRWTLLARDLTNNSPVVLKLMFMDEEMHPDDLKRFKRELQTLQSIDHPALPKYLGYFEMDLANSRVLALIQSYLAGRSLDKYLKKGRKLTETEALQIAKTTLNILSYLHDHQPPIVHRDIQPSNILLSRKLDQLASQVWLVDFGSVKSFSSTENASFTLVGTFGYMPPEQMGGRFVKASDLYSLGVTLVTAITGVEPAELPQRGLRIDLKQIPVIMACDPAFVEWLRQMIEPELTQRFKSAEEALEGIGMKDEG